VNAFEKKRLFDKVFHQMEENSPPKKNLDLE
jgi:hypothetical protein